MRLLICVYFFSFVASSSNAQFLPELAERRGEFRDEFKNFLQRNARIREEAAQCFRVVTDSILVNSVPYNRAIKRSLHACFELCLFQSTGSFPPCRSFQYDHRKFTCHFFTISNAGAIRLPGHGYDYFELREHCIIESSPSTSPVTSSTSTTTISTTTAPETTSASVSNPIVELYTVHVRKASGVPKRKRCKGILFVPGAERLGNQRACATCPIHFLGSCTEEMKPLMQLVEGYEFKTDDFITMKDISHVECLQECVKDENGKGSQYLCHSASYHRRTKTCFLIATSADPAVTKLVRKKDALFFGKTCISNAVAKHCPSLLVERFPHKVLIGLRAMTLTIPDFDTCVEMCIRSHQLFRFRCRSIMYYHNTPTRSDNCVLNHGDHKAETALFITEMDKEVDYVSVAKCHPETGLVRDLPILLIREIKTILSV